MAKFEVVEVLDDGQTKTVSGLPSFDTGTDAKHYATQLSVMNGKKYQPRRVLDLVGGHTQKGLLPIVFWNMIPNTSKAKYDFIDPMYDNKEKVVRYFKSERDKKLSTSASITLENFIRRFIATDEETFFWIYNQDKDYFSDYTFHITQDADEIEKIYDKGLDSCMSKPREFYVEEVSPVRCYATEDFALAYLLDNKKRLKARAIISPTRKLYNRIYGNHPILEIFLQKEGYRYGDNDDWVGLRIKTQTLSSRYVCGELDHYESEDDYEYKNASGYASPYLDMFQSASLTPDKEYLVLDGDGQYRLYCTNGLAYDLPEDDARDAYTCSCCGKETFQIYYEYTNGNAYDSEYKVNCYECQRTKFGIMGYDRLPVDYDHGRSPSDRVLLDDGTWGSIIGKWKYKKCTVTGKYYSQNHLPTIINETLTIDEMKEKYNEYFDLLKHAYVQTALPVRNGGSIHQEIPVAA